MVGPQLMGFMGQAMANPFTLKLAADLASIQPESMAAVEKLKSRSVSSPALWPFHAIPMPVAVKEASGSRLVDVDGREYLDTFLGFGTQALHGHNPPEVVAAVQAGLGRTVGNGYFHPIELELVDRMREFTGLESFAFLHSGTDATAAAMRLCRAFTNRRTIVKFESAVHGTHDWGVQSSVALMHGHPVTPWPARTASGVEPVPFATGVPPVQDLLVLPHLDLSALEHLEAQKDSIAGVIMESCNISFPYADKCVPFVKQVSERCQALGIPFVLDEVQTGFRWGPGGTAKSEGIHADLITYGKVLSGLGVPLSAVGGREEILAHTRTTGMNLADYGQKTTLMTTHMGNHLALLASHASLSLLASKGEEYYVRTRAKRDALQAVVAGLRAEGIPLHLVGYGDFIGTFLFVEGPEHAHDARQLTERANPAATLILSMAMRRAGLYTYSWPFVFLGDAYDDAAITHIGDTVSSIAREMKAADFPLTVPWVS